MGLFTHILNPANPVLGMAHAPYCLWLTIRNHAKAANGKIDIMLKIEDIQSSFRAGRKEAIKARIDANGKTNWLQADSVAALLEITKTYHDVMITIEAESLPDAESIPLVAAADEQFRLIANDLCNPSAFRQWLVSNKIITPTEGATRSKKSADLAADLK